jgi:hypothetical protein
LQESHNVSTIRHLTNVIIDTSRSAVEFKEIATGPLLNEIDRLRAFNEWPAFRYVEPKTAQRFLGKKAIVLQPVAECATTDDIEPFRAKSVLYVAMAYVFKNHNTGGARVCDPRQTFAPIRRFWDKPVQYVSTLRIADYDLDLVTMSREVEI